jgi:hypothetical protein
VSSFGRNDDFLVGDFLVGERRARTTAGPSTALRMTDVVLWITDIALRMTDVVMMAKISSNDHRPRGIKHKSAA